MKELFVADENEIAEGGRKVVETGGVEIGVFAATANITRGATSARIKAVRCARAS